MGHAGSHSKHSLDAFDALLVELSRIAVHHLHHHLHYVLSSSRVAPRSGSNAWVYCSALRSGGCAPAAGVG
jgi:hypothetical protein